MRKRDLPPDRQAEKEKAIALDRRLNAIQKRIGTISFRCYICGAESTTYTGAPTVPTDPVLVTDPSEVVPVSTCGSNYCMKMEMKRQDALVQALAQPQRDAYYQRRAEEREAERKKGK